MGIKLKKTLYVGLGGTGVSVLLNVKKCFIDIYGEIPPMIGFLAIDTDAAALNKEVTSNQGKSIKLGSNELLVCSVKQALSVYRNNPQKYDWVPTKNVDKLSSIQGNGAGQVRSNGRFIAFYNFQEIKDNIQTAITNINKLLPQNSPYEVDLNVNKVERPIIINVFGSIAGGTGSGMFIDTLCLIKDAVDTLAMKANLYPWILLPEVFRAMSSGPSMNNVLYNTYGALMSFDYLKHLNPENQSAALNLGFMRLDEAPFDYAYVINNTNDAGISFTKIEDIAEIIAKSAFLPSNSMGDALSTPFDNIVVQQNAATYDIRDKKAWAASTASAELIYDNQAVGRSYAYRILSQLCNTLINSASTGVEAANNFVDHQDVMIRENNGRNDLIDTLLNPAHDYLYEIDEYTKEEDLQNYISNNIDPEKIERDIKDRFEPKLERVKLNFDNTVNRLIDATVDGGIENAIKFIESLKGIIEICSREMEDEKNDYRGRNAQPQQLKERLENCKNNGIISLFKKMNPDAVMGLQQDLGNMVTNQKEEIRRDWAIRFYNSFKEYIENTCNTLQSLKTNIETLSQSYREALLKEQQYAIATSKFQIYLHQEDIASVSSFLIQDSDKIEFADFFKQKGGLHQWKALSINQIEAQLTDFAKNNSKVKEVVKRSIDDVLRDMYEKEPKKIDIYLNRLKVLAAPLWNYNTQGYNETQIQLDRFVIVGVNNRDTDLLSTDSYYQKFFDVGPNSTNFVSTHQNDRIYVMVVEDLLPIYAVNNFSAYQSDSERKATNMANYIDEKLHNRMSAENFSVLPKMEKDNLLEIWVYGFIFGYIQFDEDKETYWIQSKSRGSGIHQYRFDLSKQRDVAFDIFKSEGLAKELEGVLNEKIRREGRDEFEQKINQIKDEFSYMEKYARLSRLERENLEEPRFLAVRRLLEQEIAFMSH